MNQPAVLAINMEKLFIDFETRSLVDLRKTGTDIYAKDGSTEVLCMGYCFDDRNVELWRLGEKLPPKIFSHIVASKPVIAHNAAFEYTIWKHVCQTKYKWPVLQRKQLTCTMAAAYAMALPGSLEKVAAALGLTHQKDLKGGRLMLQLSRPKEYGPDGPLWYEELEDPEKFEQLYAYCIKDVEIEREVFKRLIHLSPKEKQVWILDQKINQRGIGIDRRAVFSALQIVEFEQDRLNAAMKELTNNQVATCNSHAQLKSWLDFQGVETEGVAKDHVIALLERENLPADIRRVLLLRQEAAKSSTAKLETMLECADIEDDRMRGTIQYHGANTGRFAGRKVQPHNFPRQKMSVQEIDEVFELLRSYV